MPDAAAVNPSAQTARHILHQWPELSGQEQATAGRITEWLQACQPDQLLTGIGGHGVIAVFGQSGPGILLRCELDALPIRETNTFEHRSQQAGVAHKCGHDGHMAIVLEVARRLHEQPLATGKIMLLFQPAEETGAGAAAVNADPQFQELGPQYAFALHNMPGQPLGSVIVREGTMNCASRGVIIRLEGKTAHAAQPETGRSPALAMSALINELQGYAQRFGKNELALATVVGARLGHKAFGTTPGQAEIYVTLRSETDAVMQRMLDCLTQQLSGLCEHHQLTHQLAFEDVFPAVNNTAHGSKAVIQAAQACGASLIHARQPIRWSEDFGHLINGRQGALFGLGAGEQHPALHNPDYDFPDALISIGADLFMAIIQECLGPAASGNQ